MTSVNINYSFKGLISKYSHIMMNQTLGLQHMNFGETIHPITTIIIFYCTVLKRNVTNFKKTMLSAYFKLCIDF